MVSVTIMFKTPINFEHKSFRLASIKYILPCQADPGYIELLCKYTLNLHSITDNNPRVDVNCPLYKAEQTSESY